MNRLIERIINQLIQNRMIAPDEAPFYSFSLRHLMDNCIFLLAVFLCGFLTGLVPETLALLLTIVPCRSLCGGFHFKKPGICTIVSFLLPAVLLLLACRLRIPPALQLTISGISAIYLFLTAPVEPVNKKFSEAARFRMRITARMYLVLLTIAFLLLLHNERERILTTITLSMLTCFISSCAGRIDLRRAKRRTFKE